MGVKWQNVFQNQTHGMDPIAAYRKEKERSDAEMRERLKAEREKHEQTVLQNRGESNVSEQ